MIESSKSINKAHQLAKIQIKQSWKQNETQKGRDGREEQRSEEMEEKGLESKKARTSLIE